MSTDPSPSPIRIGPHPSRRGCFRLDTELWLPVARQQLFAYFANPANLEALTPPWLHFQMLTPTPIALAEGSLIDYRIRLHGLPLRWRTLISAWEPDQRFVDEQQQGPYRVWQHEHTFIEVDGGTCVGDHVDYAVLGGRLIHWLLVQRDLRAIFQFRRERLLETFSKR